MFAPWILHKEDYIKTDGHDHVFAPFPYEDSDIFQRWILNGLELIQSRDAFVYHLTCRGHKWNEEVGKEDNDFPIFEENARRNYLRKWGTWIANDEFCHPVIYDKYDIGFVLENPTMQHIRVRTFSIRFIRRLGRTQRFWDKQIHRRRTEENYVRYSW